MPDEKKLIGLNELNQAVQDLHPAILAAAVAKPQKNLSTTTAALLSQKAEEKGITIEDVDAGMDTFCALCERVRPLINLATTFLRFVLTSSQLAATKLWLTVVQTKFVDKVCAK